MKSDADLSELSFAVFGLGNKTYPQYNMMGKNFDSQLAKLGARRVSPLGLGDDDGSLEEDFAHWKKPLWVDLCKIYKLTPKVDLNLFEPRFTLQTYDPTQLEAKKRVAKARLGRSTDYDYKKPYPAMITVNRELHSAGSDRNCRHVELELARTMNYSAGDHLGIYAQNDPVLVQKLAHLLGIADLSLGCALVDKTGNFVLGPNTLQNILLESIEITAKPRKAVLRALSQYTADEAEKARLRDLGDEEKHEPYHSYIVDDCRTILEILADFPNVRLPLAIALELLPKMNARFYSISSSPNQDAGKVTVTCIRVQFKTNTGRTHDGVCSTWLLNQPPGVTANCFVRRSTFHLPDDPSVPLIMVGPGTGLAPFRGFLQELGHRKAGGAKLGQNILYFGCRHSSQDYIYREELEAYVDSGVLAALYVAFSRDQAHKVYVQDKLRDTETTVFELLESGAHFYICGDAREMEPQVEHALVQLLTKHGKDGANYLQAMKDQGRYQRDTWY